MLSFRNLFVVTAAIGLLVSHTAPAAGNIHQLGVVATIIAVVGLVVGLAYDLIGARKAA